MSRIAETLKEHAATMHFGLITEIGQGENAHMVKVYLEELDFETQWLFWVERATQDDKSHDTLDIGAQVVILLDAHGVDGVVIGCINSEEDPPPVTSPDKWHRKFKDGTVIEYDRSSHVLKVDAQGEITVKASGPVKLEALNVTVKGVNVTVEAQTLVKLSAPLVQLDAAVTRTNPLLVKGLISFE